MRGESLEGKEEDDDLREKKYEEEKKRLDMMQHARPRCKGTVVKEGRVEGG